MWFSEAAAPAFSGIEPKWYLGFVGHQFSPSEFPEMWTKIQAGKKKKKAILGEKKRKKNANNLSRKFVQMVQEMAQRARNNFQPLYQIESRNTQDPTLARPPRLQELCWKVFLAETGGRAEI